MIRPADHGELDQILAVDDVATAGDLDRAADLRHGVEAGECVVHADGAGLIDGFVITSTRHFYGRDFIRLLVVSAGRRRTGIGRSLLQAALDRATTEVVFTSTNWSNQPMRTLLEHEGWSFAGELSGLDEGDPELVFWQRPDSGIRRTQ